MASRTAAETAEKHERILKEASRNIGEHGLSGVAVGDLMSAAGLTHGSFYDHFDAKPSVVCECIAHPAAVPVGRLRRPRRLSPEKRAFVSRYLSLAASDNPCDACPMPSLGSEIAREPGARSAMTRYARPLIGKLTLHFPWPLAGKTRAEAIRMTASLLGAAVLARTWTTMRSQVRF